MVKDSTWKWIASGPPGSLQLSSGRIIIPYDMTTPQGTGGSYTAYSDDQGETWAYGNQVPDANECQAAVAPNGSLVLSMRSMTHKDRLQAYSADAGRSWSPATAVFHETQCQGSIVTHGTSMLISTAYASSRSNMTVMHSEDSGASWAPLIQVYSGTAAYSSLVVLDAGHVGLLFERDIYKRLSFFVFSHSARTSHRTNRGKGLHRV
eukprot:m.130612 g.130612  ORF g.130612 m.130612 type:complete len:207 (+) comp19988_c0_seq4:367-987(+)